MRVGFSTYSAVRRNSGVGVARRGTLWAAALPTVLVAISLAFTAPAYAASLTVDGTSDRFGVLPVFPYVLTDSTGTDIYPVGTGELYLFGLFDTGSTLVAISTSSATTLGMGSASSSNPTQDVNVRLNGMSAIDPVTLGAPIGGMFGTPQAEVDGVRAAIRSIGVDLIGAPAANNVVALIDNSTIVSRGPYAFCSCNITGPDITFYNSTSMLIPIPNATFSLERFGSTTPSAIDGATTGERYYLRDVTLNNGANSVDGGTHDFLFDTGTSVTLISAAIANDLGLDLLNPDFTGMVDGVTLNGFTLTNVTLSNGSDSYVVDGAQVFVDESVVPFGGAADGIIGSNLFSQVPFLFDGPQNQIGLFLPTRTAVPAPPALVLFLTGLLGVLLVRRQQKSRKVITS